METKDVGNILKQIVEKLINKEFESIYKEDYNPNYSISELEFAINDYPEKIIQPCDPNLYLDFSFYNIDINHWKIEFNFYTINNEKTDLTLKLLIRDNDGGAFSYSIKDIRTM